MSAAEYVSSFSECVSLNEYIHYIRSLYITEEKNIYASLQKIMCSSRRALLDYVQFTNIQEKSSRTIFVMNSSGWYSAYSASKVFSSVTSFSK